MIYLFSWKHLLFIFMLEHSVDVLTKNIFWLHSWPRLHVSMILFMRIQFSISKYMYVAIYCSYAYCRNKCACIFQWECMVFDYSIRSSRNLFTSSNVYISYNFFLVEKHIIHAQLYSFSIYKLIQHVIFFVKIIKNAYFYLQFSITHARYAWLISLK